MSGHGTAARDERIGLLGLKWGLGLEDRTRMGDRLAAGGGLRMNVEVRMGDSGMIPGSSIHVVGELTDGIMLRGGKWLFSSDVVRGEKVRVPSNLTRGESIVDKCDNWDGDIGASSKCKSKKKEFSMRDRNDAVLK
jgi:hypothetical protein